MTFPTRLPLLAVLAALFAASVSASSVYYAYAGQGCGTPHTKCRGHLVCEHKVCKIKPGNKCIGRESLCAKHHVCAGKGADKTCVRPIGKGGDCLHGGVCDKGLVCAGNKYKKVCVWPVGPGGKCVGSFLPCKAGLFCQKKVCRTPVNGDCKPKYSVCAHGTVCAGHEYKRRCVYPVKEGGECGKYPLQVCSKGLKCHHHRCVGSRIPAGGNCTPKGSKCKRGLVCAGLSYDKKCIWPSNVGGPCGTPHAVCKSEFSCFRSKCLDRRGELGSRCAGDRPCQPHLTCTAGGLGGLRKTCKQIRNAGETCGFEFVCKSGLKCKRGFCDY